MRWGQPWEAGGVLAADRLTGSSGRAAPGQGWPSCMAPSCLGVADSPLGEGAGKRRGRRLAQAAGEGRRPVTEGDRLGAAGQVQWSLLNGSRVPGKRLGVQGSCPGGDGHVGVLGTWGCLASWVTSWGTSEQDRTGWGGGGWAWAPGGRTGLGEGGVACEGKTRTWTSGLASADAVVTLARLGLLRQGRREVGGTGRGDGELRLLSTGCVQAGPGRNG